MELIKILQQFNSIKNQIDHQFIHQNLFLKNNFLNIQGNIIRSVVAGACTAIFFLTSCGIYHFRWNPVSSSGEPIRSQRMSTSSSSSKHLFTLRRLKWTWENNRLNRFEQRIVNGNSNVQKRLSTRWTCDGHGDDHRRRKRIQERQLLTSR